MGARRRGEGGRVGSDRDGRMARELRTPWGQEAYRKRKWIGEPPFAWIKSAMGFDRFHLRGLRKVTSEWD